MFQFTSDASKNMKRCSTSLVICCCSVAKSCLTLCNPMDCSTPGFPVFHYLPEFAQNHVPFIGDAIQPSHVLSPSSLPALNLCKTRVFSNESALPIRWSNYWNFGISSSNEYSGLISFMTDYFDLFAVQRNLRSPLQHHNLKASILWHSAT